MIMLMSAWPPTRCRSKINKSHDVGLSGEGRQITHCWSPCLWYQYQELYWPGTPRADLASKGSVGDLLVRVSVLYQLLSAVAWAAETVVAARSAVGAMDG
jgi:hypothetical protein